MTSGKTHRILASALLTALFLAADYAFKFDVVARLIPYGASR